MTKTSTTLSPAGRPAHSLEAEVFVVLQRTANDLLQSSETLLKTAGLSHTQYNVLRILRGAMPAGLACREIAERMITRDPDITRLLDRLEAHGWVRRARERTDRRIITTRITADGLKLLKRLDEPVARLHREQLGPVGEKKLRALLRLLKVLRREK